MGPAHPPSPRAKQSKEREALQGPNTFLYVFVLLSTVSATHRGKWRSQVLGTVAIEGGGTRPGCALVFRVTPANRPFPETPDPSALFSNSQNREEGRLGAGPTRLDSSSRKEGRRKRARE